jgi:hypothetical protein
MATYLSIRQHKLLTLDIDKKRKFLEQKSVEQIVQEIKEETATIIQKTSDGKTFYGQLIESLGDIKTQLKYINVDLLPPTFKFDDRETLKEEINRYLEKQYNVIKTGDATDAYSDWDWFGSKEKGARMITAYQHLLLKAFNAEFDFIRTKMRHSTYATALSKLSRLSEQLTKLGETANVSISHEYFSLKVYELEAWQEELKHREDLKQEKKKQQALLRKQAKVSTGDTEELEDDIYYRKSDLKKAQRLAQQLHGASSKKVEKQIATLQKEIQTLEAKFARATSQAQVTKAGYIYVISNIGSFGEGVVKIGMTRRLEPTDRVRELGDASVPFRFDIHTLAFVDNAPMIENLLHKKFDKNRVNTDNPRKEFFKVSPKKVAEAMEALEVESDWYFEIEAKEYRESLLIREALNQKTNEEAIASHHLPTSI